VEPFTFETVRVDDRGAEQRRWDQTRQQFVEDLGNGVGLAMVVVPGGRFMMGSPDGEAERDADEGPQHGVTVPDFFMGKFEVTQAQWFAVMGSGDWDSSGFDSLNDKFKGDRLPIVGVSWYEARKFCQKLNQGKTGGSYRLPTEAEWEYACRAGTSTPFSFGDTITPDLVNYDGNYSYGNADTGTDRRVTTPVGSFFPNSFGLYDMHGNVYEWCEDHWHSRYHDKPDDLKRDGSLAWSSSDKNSERLLRGGFWFGFARHCRSAFRNGYSPGYRYSYVGFRVVFSAS
jgi:formylglycine-generating enzyme required for sulfatase activity